MVGFEPTLKVLQTCTSPLGHTADKGHPGEPGRRYYSNVCSKNDKQNFFSYFNNPSTVIAA